MKTLAEPRDVAEILGRLHAIRPENTRLWGTMSAHEAVCHLSDAVLVALGQKAASPATGLLQRTIIKWIALYAPLRWPPDIRTRPEIDQQQGGTRPAEFAADLARLEALLQAMTAAEPPGRWPPHPIFGAMSRADWLRWGYLHADHHLRQFGL